MIVVLVILAILAAIAIPALTGYIDKANQRAAISQAAVVRTSLQALSSDSYRTGAATALDGIKFNGATVFVASGTAAATDKFPGYSPISGAVGTATIAGELSQLTGTTIGPLQLSEIEYDDRTLKGFVFKTTATGTGGYTVTFNGTDYSVEKS